MEELILTYVRSHEKAAFRKKDLARRLNLKDGQYRTFRRTLNKLISSGQIVKIRGGKFIYASPDMFESGVLELTKAGKGFVITENEKRIYAGNGYFSGALHGDVVKIKIEYEYKGDISGVINKILSRSKKVLDGYIVRKKGLYYLEPLLKISNRPFLIKGDIKRKLKQNQWVEAEITDYPEPPSAIPVIVKKIIGDSNDPGMDLKIISKKYNLPEKFPKNVLREVDKIKSKVKFESDENRTDYTQLTTFTIDPESAKDFDDAISIERISENCNRLGIHISDVSEFIPVDSRLNAEAFKRGTSVYFPDGFIPMLPETLSSDLCSLRQDENRLSLSLFIDLDPDTNVTDFQLKQSLICVKKRFTYAQVQKLINKGSGNYFDELSQLNGISKILRKKRFKKGSLDFTIPEPEFQFDKRGVPIEIRKKKALTSHAMIEEFMLLANLIIANEYGTRFKEFQYRNHEKPAYEDLDNLNNFLFRMDKKLPKLKTWKDLPELFKNVKGSKYQYIIDYFALRALPKAIYEVKNKGHFGLAFDSYCHFTSPIRRYPDLIVHKRLKSIINKSEVKFLNSQKDIASESTRLEINAMGAERDYVKRKQLRYLSTKYNRNFMGTISGINQKGFYVQLKDSLADGFVKIETLEDDYYIFDESLLKFTGRRFRTVFTLGLEVEIMVEKVNIQRGFADFILVN